MKNKWKMQSLIALMLLLSLLMLMACNTQPRYGDVWWVSDYLAVVNRNHRGDGQKCVVNIVTGEVIVPYHMYDNIYDIYDNMIIVRHRDTRQIDIIDITSGESILPAALTIRPREMRVYGDISRISNIRFLGGEFVVVDAILKQEHFSTEVPRALFDIESGDKIIPFGRFGNAWFYNGRIIYYQDQRVLDLASGYELISRYEHRQMFLPRNGNGLVLTLYICARDVCDRFWCRCSNRLWGFVDILSGEVVLALDWQHRFLDVASGMLVAVRYDFENRTTEFGLIDIASGKTIIPFGRYDAIKVYQSGFVALRRGFGNRPWRIESIETILSRYGGRDIVDSDGS